MAVAKPHEKRYSKEGKKTIWSLSLLQGYLYPIKSE